MNSFFLFISPKIQPSTCKDATCHFHPHEKLHLFALRSSSGVSDKRLCRALHCFLLQTKLCPPERTSAVGRGGHHYVLMNPVLIYTFQVLVSKRFSSSRYPKLRCEHYSISTTFPLPLPPLRTQHTQDTETPAVVTTPLPCAQKPPRH